MTSILLKGGRVIDPASGHDGTADILIDDRRIAAIQTTPIAPPDGTVVVDAEGLLVTPGLLDIHVHLREPGPRHRETVATGAAAAVNGGFATVACMPNTTPALDTAMNVEFIHDRAAAADQARVFVVGCATQNREGERLAEIASMAKAGIVGVTDDGDVIASPTMMQRALATAKAHDLCLMQHCQDPDLARGGAMNAGALATRLGLPGWPSIAEELVIERDIRLNRSIGCRYHVQHMSSGDSVAILEAAQRDGQPVTGEVSPHHLLLTEEACDGYETNAKMNPPLRTRADINALKEGVARGVITVLATDHAPHPAETKDTDFVSAAYGIVGLECALPLYAKALIEDGVLDWPGLIAMMTINGARLCGLDRRGLGSLTIGGPADVTLIDPTASWTIDPDAFLSTGRNCPFAGVEVKSRAEGVIVNGRFKLLRGASRARTADAAVIETMPGHRLSPA